MLVALTGTPGVGKTSVADILHKNGFKTVDLNKLSLENNFFLGVDKRRNSKIIDIDRLDKYIEKNYKEFNNIVFLDGHIAHLLVNIDKIIILRCNPVVLRKRLESKGWKEEKIKENIDAEILDIILCESTDVHSEKDIFEIDTTDKTPSVVASIIMDIAKNGFKQMKKYNIGQIDWLEGTLSKKDEEYGSR